MLAVTIQAVRESGVKSFTAKVGHLGLFKALLDGLNIPPRWRERLGRAFWRHAAFARELATLSRANRRWAGFALPRRLTEGGLLDRLEASGIPLVGLRRPAEIVQRLQDKAADAKEPPSLRKWSSL